jgi:hypothetical protein
MNDLTCTYNQALKKIHKVKLFYTHTALYLTLNIILLTINLAINPDYLWFIWPLVFWTKGLVLHALSTFDKSTSMSPEHIKAEMAAEEV